jgi:Flp pilus assembly protein TadG
MRSRNNEHGMAVPEFLVIMPVLLALLMLVVEGSFMLRAYSTLNEASREGARLVMREGEAVDVPAFVDSLISDLPVSETATTVSVDSQANIVTVEVDYAYHSFFLDTPLVDPSTGEAYQLTASTSMPLP